MEIEKIMVFPYSDNIEFLKYANIRKKVKITSAVCFKGSGYEGKIFETGEEPVVVTSDFDYELDDCTTIFPLLEKQFARREGEDLYEDGLSIANRTIITKVKKAVTQNKKVIVLEDHSHAANALKNIVPDNLRISIMHDFFEEPEKSLFELYSIKTPIVYLIKSFDGLKGMTLLKNFEKCFSDCGYNILIIGDTLLSKTIGNETNPFSINANGFDDTEQIILFNNFLKIMEKKYSPDIIFVLTSSGSAVYSQSAPINFGCELYKMVRAQYPSYAILLLPYYQYGDIELMQWRKYYKACFGIEIGEIFVDNKTILNKDTENLGNPHFLDIDSTVIESLKDSIIGNRILSCTDRDVKAQAEIIINKLEEDSSYNLI